MTVPPTESSVSSASGDGPTHVSRRRALYAGVAAAAALGGAGLAWWRLQPRAVQAGAEQALWTQAFDTPEGAQLAMGAFAGKPLLLNFWATWCPPCVEELPLLNTFHRENKANGWQVWGWRLISLLRCGNFWRGYRWISRWAWQGWGARSWGAPWAT